MYAHHHLARTRPGIGQLGLTQGLSLDVEDHRPHAAHSPPTPASRASLIPSPARQPRSALPTHANRSPRLPRPPTPIRSSDALQPFSAPPAPANRDPPSNPDPRAQKRLGSGVTRSVPRVGQDGSARLRTDVHL